MKKTLLAALVAASFGVSAYAGVTLPVANSAGNPISVVVSGKVDLQGVGQYYKFGTDDSWKSTNMLGYNINSLKLGLDVSTPFMKSFMAFGHISLSSTDVSDTKVFKIKQFYVGVSNDAYGTFTIGMQPTASDDFGYNGFGDYDIMNPANASGVGDDPGYSIKFQSPEYMGVTVAASLGYTYSSDTNHAKGKDDVTNSSSPNSLLSLAAQYVRGPLTVAATVDLQKSFETKAGEDQHHYGSFATSLGGGYTYQNITGFANIGYSTNEFVDLGQPDMVTDTPKATEYTHLMQVGGQVGASIAVTGADTVTAAFQTGSVWQSGKDNKAYVMMFGFEAAASHSFNDNFTASLFFTYNHLGFKNKDVDSSVLPSGNFVNYGLDVKYSF